MVNSGRAMAAHWGSIINQSPFPNHARNRSPTTALNLTTPYEVFYNKKPDVSTLRIFGSRCHVRIAKDKRKKLDAHSLDGILCGFADRSKAYEVWIPSRHKFVTSRDVIVYEKLPEHEIEPVITSTQGEGVTQDVSASNEGITNIPTVIESEQPPAEPPPVISTSHEDSVSTSSAPAPNSVAELPPPPSAQPRRSERTVRPSWIKAAGDAQKARELQTNKSIKQGHSR